jgi:1-aminocyclopropane-1-carboxylate synthase
MLHIGAAATSLHDLLAWALADAGDGFLMGAPVYGRFEIDFTQKSQVKPVYVHLDPETCLAAQHVDKFEEALAKAESEGTKIRAVVIVNPNNPLGIFLLYTPRL